MNTKLLAVVTPPYIYQFVVKYQFENDEVTGVWIKFTHCNKKVTFQFSETFTIYILPVFINAVVFHHLGLSWIIETKDHYGFSVDEKFPNWCTGGSLYNTFFFRTYTGLYLGISL